MKFTHLRIMNSNNIFDTSRCFIFMDNTSVPTWSYTTCDYNCWYTQHNTDTIAAFWTSSSLNIYTQSQFSTYQTNTNQDIHSFIANPLFVNPSSNNYYLTSASSCINTGTNTGISFDFNLTTRPQGGYYDIGAYEYISTTGVKQFGNNKGQETIFPNPTSDQFFIDANTTEKLNVELYDVNGRHVYSASVSDKSNINVTALENGIYTLTIKSVDRVTNKKLIIVR